MKKSFLSFLLGVAVIASTSVFVSCQDYEDEFKDLQEQINKEHPSLNEKVAALQTEIANLEATVAALQEQHDKDVATLKAADKALEDLLSDEIVKANAYALAQAEKALADAKAYADAKAAEKAEQALKDAMAYADKVAAAEAQKEAQAALLAANEQSQKLYLDAIDQLNKAVETINAQIATEKSERQAADAALEKGYKDADAAIEAAYKAADAEIWVALNKAQKDIEAAQAAADKAQATANEALALAKANEKAINTEVERAKKAEADLKAALDEEAARAKAEEAKIWEAIAEANAKIAANAARIEEVYNELNKKIDAAVDRIKTLENKVSTLQEEMKAAQDKLNDHETRIKALEAWVEAWEPQIKDLQSRMATAETKIEDLYKKLAAEEAARIAADEELQKQITANAEAIAQEIKDRVAADQALQKQIDQNKKDIAANKEAIEALQEECEKIWEALEKETDARVAGDNALQDQIDTINDKIDALDKAIKALDDKVEKYYTELDGRLKVVEAKLDSALENPFEVISEVDFQAALAPAHFFKYYPAFEVEVADTTFEEDNRVVEGSYEQTPGKVYVLLAPQGNNFTGHQIYVRDEKNADYPGYTFGTAVPAVYPEDVYFNFTFGWATRSEVEGEEQAPEETVTGPIWMADITAEDPTNEELLDQIEDEYIYVLRATKEDETPTFGLVPRYSVIAEYTQKNTDLKDVKLLVWDENFDFYMLPDSYDYEKADELNKDDFKFETPTEEYDVTVDFTNADDELIYKQMVVCDSAYNECGDLDEEAAAYMNALDEKFGKWVESAELDDFTVTVDQKYANFTFFYTWYVVGLSGEVLTFTDEALIVPEFDPVVEATFNYEVTPASAELQTSDVLTKSVEGYTAADLTWCKYVPECQVVTVEFAPVKAAPEDALFFNLADAPAMYPAPVAKETESWTKAEMDIVKSLSVTYDPAKLVVDEPYQYTVTVKYGDELISISTINIIMRRPEGHDIELEKITSAWNKAKTETIVWAQGYEGASEEQLSDAWYLLQGSFIAPLDSDLTFPDSYLTAVDADGCTLVFTDKTDYTDAAAYEVVAMPNGYNDFQLDVPAVAVQKNTGYKELSFTVLEQSGWWYNLAYGTNVFGLESLYGGENEFAIAYCSPIYYDGVTYNWEKQVYEGGCKLAKDVYLIEFPRQETLINEADFVGSNDPSTSVVDPIKYFGADRDYRILDVTVELGDAEEIKGEYPDYYVWNDPTNEYLFETLPEVTEEGIYFKTYNEQPSLQSIPAFYYNLTVIDIWGCKKTYPFVISVNPNTPMN